MEYFSKFDGCEGITVNGYDRESIGKDVIDIEIDVHNINAIEYLKIISSAFYIKAIDEGGQHGKRVLKKFNDISVAIDNAIEYVNFKQTEEEEDAD